MTVSDTWQQGDPYERYIGRWSREVAPKFLEWLAVPKGRKFADIGCGTGALAGAILAHCAPSLVVGVEPSPGFAKSAKENLAGRALVFQGSATSIPLDDDAVDVVVSGLVLNFVPDPRAALIEMARVAHNDGTVAAYVWDYAGKMQLIRRFWDAAVELDPAAKALDEGPRFPLCNPDALAELFAGAGLRDVATTTLDVPTKFTSFDDYWQPFEGGQGPAPAYAMSLDEAARTRLREHLRTRLPVTGKGAISLTARAFGVRGTVAK
ncbi:MAG: class I SAM-dependent methyltransferase [Burkholderiales bacterium]|nr:class I SAM-dependent methyltransferase [Burkholderiales bacterium]